ncbi:MAG: hypothetical protein ACRESV_04200 [Nevskiales bacterium]
MNTKKIWTALAMAGLLMAGCQSSPSGGETSTGGAAQPKPSASGGDLAAMDEALAKTTSWRMTIKGKTGEAETDFVCPDKVRTVRRTGGTTVEVVHIGDDVYTKAGATWMKTSAKGQQAICRAGNRFFAPSEPSGKEKITKGGTATVNGEICQEWIIGPDPSSKVKVTVNNVVNPSTTVCVGSDNLPRKMESAGMVITYSNWNKVPPIEVPK